MSNSTRSISVGVPHRTLRNLNARVYTWDALVEVESRFLREGTLFQPWEPPAHARGRRVPITLGSDASEHGWGKDTPEGLFLTAIDFAESCIPVDAPKPPTLPPVREQERASPFDELPAIAAQLYATIAGQESLRARVDQTLAALEPIARLHAWAAEMELGAMGFDNTDDMRRYAETKDHLARAASEILAAFRRAVL